MLVVLSFSVWQVHSRLIKFFASYSLALYCLHFFVYLEINRLITLPFRPLSDFIVVVALTSFLGVILRMVLSPRIL